MTGEDRAESRLDDVLEVVRTMLDYPQRGSNLWLKDFPRGSCSVVSYAISQVLQQRHGERWYLLHHDAETDYERDAAVDYSHVWLSLDTQGQGPSIDASMHQFVELDADGPFVGEGPTPFQRRFATADQRFKSIRADEVERWWHHGQTIEVYEWIFPRLGIYWSAPGG